MRIEEVLHLMAFDLKEIIAARLGENYKLHERHVNPTLVAAQRVIGFDKVYARAEGAYLYDMDNQPYLDFLSGYSVFNIGRNHPRVQQAIRDVLDLELPNMVQMDCSLLSGLLAEAITKRTPPHLNAVFFCNSGTEAMEGALKFARAATGRKRAVSLASAFHGLSLGALSLMGCESFTEGFGPLMEGFDARVPLDDIDELDRQLRSRDVAAFVIETVQGKGCQTPKSDFFVRAQELCRKYGTLLISDEVQTGLGRTGKMFGFQHWDLEPDIITLAKTLSGGYVPCGAIVTRSDIQLPGSLAVDPVGQHLYWIDWGMNKIRRSNLDGTNIVDVYAPGTQGPSSLSGLAFLPEPSPAGAVVLIGLAAGLCRRRRGGWRAASSDPGRGGASMTLERRAVDVSRGAGCDGVGLETAPPATLVFLL